MDGEHLSLMLILIGRGALRLPVFAVCIDARVGQPQSLNGFAANDVRLDNFVHIGWRDVAVPDPFGIHDEIGPVLALVKAARLIGANPVLQPTLRQLLFEQPLQFSMAIGITAAARAVRRTLIAAHKNVPFELRHTLNVQECPDLQMPDNQRRTFRAVLAYAAACLRSNGSPACCQASNPPRSAQALGKPCSWSICAKLALEPSFGQVQ
jgi:hypothetical protein